MRTTDISALLRIKRAREERATAQASAARAAARVADEHRYGADAAALRHAESRIEQESRIHASLLVGPIPSAQVRAATARLAGIVAMASHLARECDTAAGAQIRTAQRSLDAARARAAAARDAEAALLLHQQSTDRARAAEACASEAEMEEVAAARATHPRRR